MLRFGVAYKVMTLVKPFRIIYAEDDDSVRAVISDMMVERGFAVHECSNGGEAVQLCSVFEADVVLLDLSMPVMDGFEAARRIREQKPERKTRLVALTGACGDLKQAMLAGFDQLLRKPVSVSALLNALQRWN